MARFILYLAITSHGFGHAVRVCSVAAAIRQLCPESLLILVTRAPHWLLASYLGENFIYRPRALDVGVIQSDSLTMDKAATLEKMQQLRSRQNAIIAGEVNFIRTNQVSLILADIPPLAALIAQAAGIPCWMMGNFGWDFIYQKWGGEFSELTHWISQCYQQCDRLFRLPMCEPMPAFSKITDVGLTGGIPRYSEEHLRSEFKLTSPRDKTILLTFGGLGLQQIPYHNLERFPEWQFISFDSQTSALPNLLTITNHHYRPVDFLPICGRVVSKPGYSTFAEAMRLKVPIVSLTREDFAETPLLLEGIQNYAEHQIITPEAFFGGNWNFLNNSPQLPRQGNTLATDGAEVIAREVVAYLKQR